MVQRRQQTDNINTSSVGEMLQHLNQCSHEDWCKDAQLLMIYKIENDSVTVTKKTELRLRQSQNIHSLSLIITPCKTQRRQE